MAGRRVVIVGAGIGGLTTAVGLHSRGCEVLVLERAPRLEPVGAGISLWPNALRALDAVGVADSVRAMAAISGRTGVRRPDGHWVARSDVGGAVRARFGDPLVVVHRARLVELLVSALPNECVRTATAVTGVDHTGARPVVHTDRGDEPADLVVGADGIRSTVREAVFSGQVAPRYAGYTAWRMVVPALEPNITPFETWGRHGQRFAVLPLGEDQWYCYATATVPAGRRIDDETQELAARFGNWHDPIPHIIASLAPEQLLKQDVEELDGPLPAMHCGRVVLVGDSAHATTPDLGQGGCMALEDAVELAALVTDEPLDAALAKYTQRRLPRTTMVARRSRRAGRLYQSPYPIQLAAARLMGLVPDTVVARGLASLLEWKPPSRDPRTQDSTAEA